MTTTALEGDLRRTGADFLTEAARAARVDRVRAREARSMAAACEQRARRAPGSSAMYLREALRLRRAAAALEVDAALHDEAVVALWQLIDVTPEPPRAGRTGRR